MVGAEPVIVVLGLVVAVPPEMLVFDPAVPDAGWNQVVTRVNTVAEDDAWVRIYSPVYGDAVLLSWNMVAGVDVS